MTIGDMLNTLMVIQLLIHHLLALLKPTCYHSPVLFYSLSRRQIVQLLGRVSFQWFYKGVIAEVKTVSKENCYQLKKYSINLLPCIYQRVTVVFVLMDVLPIVAIINC